MFQLFECIETQLTSDARDVWWSGAGNPAAVDSLRAHLNSTLRFQVSVHIKLVWMILVLKAQVPRSLRPGLSSTAAVSNGFALQFEHH